MEQGFTVWFTGLSGAGKSTLAGKLQERLSTGYGRRSEILDGDVVRTHLSKGLGFSREDRDINVLRVAWVCELLTRNRVSAIAATISPYRDTRCKAREMVGPDRFIEVYLDVPFEICEQRDVKGLYAGAKAGNVQAFTGRDDPYEPPAHPDVICRTHQETVEESVERILFELRRRNLVTRLEDRFEI